jgi:hypothetical protein
MVGTATDELHRARQDTARGAQGAQRSRWRRRGRGRAMERVDFGRDCERHLDDEVRVDQTL